MPSIPNFKIKFPLILLSVVLITVIVSVIAVLFISSRAPQQSASITQPENQLSQKSAAYAVINAPENGVSYEIFLYNPEEQTSRKIFERSQTAMSTPRFFVYQNKILITSDTEVKLIDQSGNAKNEFINPYNPFVSYIFSFSPSGNKLAYIQRTGTEPSHPSELQFVIRDTRTGTEKTLDAGNTYNTPGMLRPRTWDRREQYVYADRVIEADGFELGLAKINAETLQVEDVQKVSELGLVNYVFDQQDHLFALRGAEVDPYTRKEAKNIIRLTLSTGEEKTFTLEKTSAGRLFAADPLGRYLAYEQHYSEGEQSELWLYDTKTDEEILVTQENVSASGFSMEIVSWNEDVLLFATVFMDPKNQIHYTLQLFDAKTKSKQTINSLQGTPPEGKRIETIGWL